MEKALDSLISAWGAPGALIVVQVVVIIWLGQNLRESYRDRISQAEKYLEEKFADSREATEVLRNLKTSIDVSVKTMETAMAVIKSKVQS